jgi:HTH DNA binding domain
MSGDPENDEINWFRPVWETDDEANLEPPGPPRARKPPVAEPDYDHPLLLPLARAQDAVARLEAKIETASEAVAEGLRVRMAYLEAAGWLRHAHIWVHPWDLALRDENLTTSYGVAAFGDRLATVLPATIAQEPGLDAAPSDILVNRALRLARLWRRLAEMRTWRPLADADALRETLQSLGCRVSEEAVLADWLAGVYAAGTGPVLIRAGRAALDWMCQPGVKDRDPDSVFLAACLWREKSGRAAIPLPFWSAPELHHHRLGLQFGLKWMAEFLECVTAAAMVGLRELERLRKVEEKGRLLGATARSRLPDAFDAVLRASIVTASSLAKTLDVTPRAALGLLQQLVAAGIVREATGRASWRAFALK